MGPGLYFVIFDDISMDFGRWTDKIVHYIQNTFLKCVICTEIHKKFN